MALVRRGTSPGAAFALHVNRLRRDLNDLTDERIKPLRVSASVGAECLRLPSIDRYQATAKVHDFVLRHHGTKGIDTQRNPSPLTTDQGIELVFWSDTGRKSLNYAKLVP